MSLTVSELIADLMKLPPDAMVVVQTDPEGNGFHEARGAELANWINGAAEPYSSTDDSPACVVVFP